MSVKGQFRTHPSQQRWPFRLLVGAHLCGAISRLGETAVRIRLLA